MGKAVGMKRNNTRVYAMVFAKVYPFYIAKAEKKGRTKAEVDMIITWLTGYTEKKLASQIKKKVDFETFYHEAPKPNPARKLITGVVCGVRIEDIEDPLMREVRYLDKLVDELAKGRTMEKILRKGSDSSKIEEYHNARTKSDRDICILLRDTISAQLKKAERKMWHGHPVWFLEGNPIVGYSKQKQGIRLMFWSGRDFGEEKLCVVGKKFKDASVFYNEASEIDVKDLHRWLRKSQVIQWDYQYIVKRKGKLIRLK
jgi:hypothetical protein